MVQLGRRRGQAVRRAVMEACEPRVLLTAAPTYTFAEVSLNGIGPTRTGQAPYNLLLDANGGVIGTTSAGGPNAGTVFHLTSGSGPLSTLASFDANTTGTFSHGGLVEDAQGNLYGTTIAGGQYEYGTIFKLTPAAGTTSAVLTTLTSFTFAGGANPVGGVVMDAAGDLFGTTTYGGLYDNGTIFEWPAGAAVGSAPVTLETFNAANGAFPAAALTMDAAGNLYGTTQGGGADGAGTVFKLTAGTAGGFTFSTVASFDSTNGAAPVGTLVVDSGGNLFGTTTHGGASGYGVIYEVSAGATTEHALYSFNGTNGANPLGALLTDGAGNLFGVAAYGGASNAGVVFQYNLNATAGAYSTLFTFNGTNGNNPNGGLVMDAQGDIFGTTTLGGTYNLGTVFNLSVAQVPSVVGPMVAAVAAGGSVAGIPMPKGPAAVPDTIKAAAASLNLVPGASFLIPPSKNWG